MVGNIKVMMHCGIMEILSIMSSGGSKKLSELLV
jgi:hypothetical protein